MAQFWNDNSAIPAGSAPTNGNSGGLSNTAYTDVANAGVFVGYQTPPMLGCGPCLAQDATNTAVAFVGWSSLSLATVGVRMTMLVPTAAPSTNSFGNIQIRGASAFATEMSINTSGNLVIQDATSASKHTFTSFIATYGGQIIDFELGATKGTTTGNGRIWAAFYQQYSATALDSYDSGTTVDTLTGNFADLRIGKYTAHAWEGQSGNLLFDNFAYNDSALSCGVVPALVPKPALIRPSFQSILRVSGF
jgi:hypothetical protein